jgi:hypothetical protein
MRDNKHMVAITGLQMIAKSDYVLPELLPVPEVTANTSEPI